MWYNNVEVEDKEICPHISTAYPSDYDFVLNDPTLQGILPLDDLERGLANAEELNKSDGADNNDVLAVGFKSRCSGQGGGCGGCGHRNGGGGQDESGRGKRVVKAHQPQQRQQ